MKSKGGFKNIFYATICIPIFAETKEEAFSKAHLKVGEALAEFSPTELFGEVVSIEKDTDLNPPSDV